MLHIPYANNCVMNLAVFMLSESSVLKIKLIKIPLYKYHAEHLSIYQ